MIFFSLFRIELGITIRKGMSAETENSKLSRRPRPEVHIYRPGSGPLRKSCSNVENIKPTDGGPAANNTSPDTASTHRDVSMSHRENPSEQSKKLGDSRDSPKSKNSPNRRQERTRNTGSQPQRDSGCRNVSKKTSVSNDKPNTRLESPAIRSEIELPRDLREKLLEKQHQKTNVNSNARQDTNADTSSVDRDETSNFSQDKVKNGHSEKKNVKRRNPRPRLDSTRSDTSHSAATSAGQNVQVSKDKGEKRPNKTNDPIPDRRNARERKDGMIRS